MTDPAVARRGPRETAALNAAPTAAPAPAPGPRRAASRPSRPVILGLDPRISSPGAAPSGSGTLGTSPGMTSPQHAPPNGTLIPRAPEPLHAAGRAP